jgi:hypothetical protein
MMGCARTKKEKIEQNTRAAISAAALKALKTATYFCQH